MNSITTQLTQLRAPFEKKIATAKAAYDKTASANKKSVEAAATAMMKTTEKAKADYEKLRQTAETEQAAKQEELRLAQEALEQFEAQAREILTGTSASTKGHQSNGAAKAGVKTEKAIHGSKTAKKQSKKLAAKTAKKTTAKANGAGAKRALQGREEVKANKRPPLVAGIRLILGRKTMKSTDITAELQKRGWEPNSNNLGSYISQIMSANSHGDSPVFEPVKVKGRGNYRVRDGAKPLDPKVRKLFGHVGSDDDKTTVAPKAAAKPAAKKVAVKAAPKAKGGQRQCSTCFKEGKTVLGHNAAGHDNWLVKQAAGSKLAAPKKTATAKKTAAKTATKAAAAKPGKGEQKCGKCAVLGNEVFGHNAKGHDKWAAAQAAGSKPAAAPKAAPAPKAPKAAESKPAAETKSASTETIVTPEVPKSGFKTADELLAGGNGEEKKPDTVMADAAAAFGGAAPPPA